MKDKIAICWLRRDLRLHDHAALYHALKNHERVLLLFIFDRAILDTLEDPRDRRVSFIYNALLHIQAQLAADGSSIKVAYGFPEQVFTTLLNEYSVSHVYAGNDYESYALQRDQAVYALLQQHGIPFITYKDHVIFEKGEVVKPDGCPYTVFTPYSVKWKSLFNAKAVEPYPVQQFHQHLYRTAPFRIPELSQIGFEATDSPSTEVDINTDLVRQYQATRDFPGIHGTSRLGVHLRFGTISIREVARIAAEYSPTFLNELIWREFYQQILWHYPQVGKGRAFRRSYENIQWRNNENEFAAWCEGRTGYPLVDAGMRELNATGFMHNRVRMVVASFLCKHLLIDWRWGEAYFAGRLLDYELASNNGGWQWASGSGCDAVPYFRIFNPTLQTKKFDAGLTYISMWIPELNSFAYPPPIVDHAFARQRAIEAYSKAVRTPV